MPWQKLFGTESTSTLMTMPVDLEDFAKVKRFSTKDVSVFFCELFGTRCTSTLMTMPVDLETSSKVRRFQRSARLLCF
jgi:hypothetical protein